MPTVEFEREGVVVEARAGQTLLAVADAAGVQLFRGLWPALHCRRRPGWCRRCKVWVRAGGRARAALACRVTVDGPLAVHTRPGGPPTTPSLAARAPAWDNALSARTARRATGTGASADAAADRGGPAGGENR